MGEKLLVMTYVDDLLIVGEKQEQEAFLAKLLPNSLSNIRRSLMQRLVFVVSLQMDIFQSFLCISKLLFRSIHRNLKLMKGPSLFQDAVKLGGCWSWALLSYPPPNWLLLQSWLLQSWWWRRWLWGLGLQSYWLRSWWWLFWPRC